MSSLTAQAPPPAAPAPAPAAAPAAAPAPASPPATVAPQTPANPAPSPVPAPVPMPAAPSATQAGVPPPPPAPAAPLDLLTVRRVYLLQMNGGLDQYLTDRLTRTGRFLVVTDPMQADAIFTDRVGMAFEQRLKELFPGPKEPEPPVEPEPDVPASGSERNDREAAMPFSTQPAPMRVSSFGRGKGTIFLVDHRSKHVLWSSFRMPKNSRSESMSDMAETIVGRLHGQIRRLEKERMQAAKGS